MVSNTLYVALLFNTQYVSFLHDDDEDNDGLRRRNARLYSCWRNMRIKKREEEEEEVNNKATRRASNSFF